MLLNVAITPVGTVVGTVTGTDVAIGIQLAMWVGCVGVVDDADIDDFYMMAVTQTLPQTLLVKNREDDQSE